MRRRFARVSSKTGQCSLRRRIALSNAREYLSSQVLYLKQEKKIASLSNFVNDVT